MKEEILEAKRRLYLLLMKLNEDTITDNEVDIMLLLSKDEQIQSLFETEEIKLDNENLKFLNDLRKLDKEELVDFLYEYWIKLKTDAENDREQKNVYMAVEFGNIKMTQVNRLKNLANIKSMNK